jgi:hypothetical protein
MVFMNKTKTILIILMLLSLAFVATTATARPSNDDEGLIYHHAQIKDVKPLFCYDGDFISIDTGPMVDGDEPLE